MIQTFCGYVHAHRVFAKRLLQSLDYIGTHQQPSPSLYPPKRYVARFFHCIKRANVGTVAPIDRCDRIQPKSSFWGAEIDSEARLDSKAREGREEAERPQTGAQSLTFSIY